MMKTMLQKILPTALAAALLGIAWAAVSHLLSNTSGSSCRCFPGDPCWPSSAQWSSFNASIGGKLVATVPIASPCHDTFPGVSYDAEACAAIRASWDDPALHEISSSSPMAPFFANMSCDPFTGVHAPCEIGAYVPYAVNASDASDYAATLAFAKEHNIRLVIRNTGHDYFGKSTGAGALALWTRHLKKIEIFDYEDGSYTGKAMRMGAGVQAIEAQAAANAEGLIVMQGDCETVGLAGGYTQGGGTSPLSSVLGLAADSVLEWEVVTAAGDVLKATASGENADLYWALSGGGGGTYGAVLSMTVKLYPNMPTAGASLSFMAPEDSPGYWSVIRGFLMNLPAYEDAGATAYWVFLPGNAFILPQAFLPNGTAEELEALLAPTLTLMKQSGIPYRRSTCFLITHRNLARLLRMDVKS